MPPEPYQGVALLWTGAEAAKIMAMPPGTLTIATTPAPEVPEPEAPNYGYMKKPELIAAAEALGLDSSGTKADLIAKLTGAVAEEAAPVEEPVAEEAAPEGE